MRRPSLFLIAVAVWIFAEFAAFWVVVHFAGLAGAILLGILTTLAGFGILRRLGAGAAKTLKQAMQGDALSNGNMLDGLLTALGAVLLILPGFLSDLIGFALAAPSLRQWISRRFGGTGAGQRPKSPDVIDLSPGDWSQIERPAGAPDSLVP